MADSPSGEVLAGITADALSIRSVEEFVSSSWSGAVVTFAGVVRDHDHGASVNGLEYEAHPDAARFIEECCATVAEKYGLRVAAIHRVGMLAVGDLALVAAVAAPHRSDAFAACAELIDRVKTTVPIWKRQHLAEGVTEWVGL